MRRGSSPLMRGKLAPPPHPERDTRLIPAHAGKTLSSRLLRFLARAHPRSRGENLDGAAEVTPFTGSSPLTRGKRVGFLPGYLAAGLIPAHTGKTRSGPYARWSCGAHPRSYGENVISPFAIASRKGSSPLTRGKRSQKSGFALYWGLIPAHAWSIRFQKERTPPSE